MPEPNHSNENSSGSLTMQPRVLLTTTHHWGVSPADDVLLDLVRLERRAYERVHARMAAQQLGECFGDQA